MYLLPKFVDFVDGVIHKKNKKLEAKDVLPNKLHAGRRKGRKIPFFVPGDIDL